ncbi:hypothetical protein HS125_10130 [bacterium]|nr:hypothetical protein [bacterium]
MSRTFQVLVSLKIPDAVANTALNTIRRRMNLTEVASLSRAEWWCAEFDDACPDPQDRLRALVERTGLFMNPNKHRYQLIEGATPPPAPAGAAHILVVDREDTVGAAAQEAARAHPLAGGALRTLRRGVLWTLAAQPGQGKTSRQIAEELAVSTHRTAGLFSNPHYQDAILPP